MKAILLTPLCVLLNCTLVPGQSEKSGKPVYRDAQTHEDIAKMSRRATDPMKNMVAIKGKDPAKVTKIENILDRSDILCYNGLATIVPKRAILASPEKFKDRLQLVEGVRMVSWPEFYSKNRGWITHMEVSRKQAEGVEPFDEKVSEFIDKSSKLIVATYRSGPISVLPPKEPEEKNSEESNQNQPTTIR